MRLAPWLIAGLLFGGGCSTTSEPPPVTTVESAPLLPLRAVPWKSPALSLGKIAAAVDLDGTIAVFSDLGVSVLAGGVVSASDDTLKSFLGAAAIASADGRGRWIVALSADGRVFRMRSDATLDDVTDRYGLTKQKLNSVAAMGDKRVVFGYVGGYAIADDKEVLLYTDPDLTEIVGGGGKIAGKTKDGARVLDAKSNTMRAFTLPNVRSIALDASGHLILATDKAVYVEWEDGALYKRYADTDTITSLATAGSRTWVVAGRELVLLEGDKVFRSKGANIPEKATVSGIDSGDVWLYAAGTLARYGVDSESNVREKAWADAILPIYAKTCSKCHAPGGTGGSDLSNYAGWSSRVPKIEERVVVRKDMPPAGTTLTDEDRAAIATWVAAQK